MRLAIRQKLVMSLVVSLIFLNGCKTDVERVIEGPWSIDTVYYDHYDIIRCLSSNAISFKGSSCNLPMIFGDCEGLQETSREGNWKIHKSDSVPLILNIKSENRIFNGSHRIVFIGDKENKLLKMILVSDKFYLVCRKGVFAYSSNLDLVENLEEATWIRVE